MGKLICASCWPPSRIFGPHTSLVHTVPAATVSYVVLLPATMLAHVVQEALRFLYTAIPPKHVRCAWRVPCHTHSYAVSQCAVTDMYRKKPQPALCCGKSAGIRRNTQIDDAVCNFPALSFQSCFDKILCRHAPVPAQAPCRCHHHTPSFSGKPKIKSALTR